MRTLGSLAAVVLLAWVPAAGAAAPSRAFRTPPAYASYAPALREADSLLWAQCADEALRRSADVRALAVARGERWPEMATYLLDAVANGMSGRGPQTEAAARTAGTLARTLGDPAYERRALRWLAFGLGLEGRSAASDSAWRVLLRSSTAAHDSAHMGYAHLGIAYLALTRGDGRSAREHYLPAVRMLNAAGDLFLASTARVGLARADGLLGLVSEERRLFLEILAEARREGRGRSEADALNNLGSLEYRGGDPEVAVAYWQQAVERFRGLGNLDDGLISVGNLSVALQELGRLDEAIALIDSGLAVARRQHVPRLQGRLLARRGEALLNFGHPAEAGALFEQALAVAPPDDAELLATIRLDQVRVLQRLAAPDEAAAFALRELPPLMTRVLPEQRLELEVSVATVLSAAGRPREALAHAQRAVELGRSGALRGIASFASMQEGVALHGLGDRAGALAALGRARTLWLGERAARSDPERRERSGAAGAQIAMETAELLLDGRDADPARLRAAYDALQSFKNRTLLERMAGPGSAPEPAKLPPSVTLDRLQHQILRADEVLLDAFTSPWSSMLFVVTRARCRLIRLPGTTVLGERLALYYRLLAARPRDGQDQELRERTSESLADELLGAGSSAVLAARHVLVSPDGPLNLLPFAELPLRHGADRELLGAGREVTRVPSATVLAQIRTRAIEPQHLAHVLAWQGAADAAHSPLPGAEAEVSWLAEHVAHVEVHDGREARSLPGDAAFGAWDVLHFATHTRVRDQRPWDSGLLLADSASTSGQGWLVANRITQLRLRAGLVVLAGCETARGGVLSGEGAQGLASAFLAAGAPAVVSSLWRVDDAATAAFVTAFYRHLLAGQSVAGAVGRAQAELRASAGTSSPYYWAGFVVVGDGSRGIALRPRSPAGR